jgi:hypothetical protein
MRHVGLLVFIALLMVILAACGEDASRTPVEGDTLLHVTFEDPADWETGAFPVDAETPASVLAIDGGQYRIDHRAAESASFVWGAGGDMVENVIVETQTEQVSTENDNFYGIGCRLHEGREGISGYVLLISGDGHYGIARLSNRSLSFILDWHQTDAINKGRADNTIRAVCVDDYLALYANDEFLGDVTDDRFMQPGQVGLFAGVTKDHLVSVVFDDMTLYEGRLEDE